MIKNIARITGSADRLIKCRIRYCGTQFFNIHRDTITLIGRCQSSKPTRGVYIIYRNKSCIRSTGGDASQLINRVINSSSIEALSKLVRISHARIRVQRTCTRMRVICRVPYPGAADTRYTGKNQPGSRRKTWSTTRPRRNEVNRYANFE